MANESRPAMDGMLDAVRRNDTSGLVELATRFLRVVEGFVRDNGKIVRALRDKAIAFQDDMRRNMRPAGQVR